MRCNHNRLWIFIVMILSSRSLFAGSFSLIESNESRRIMPSLKDQNLVPLISDFAGSILVSPKLVIEFLTLSECIKTLRFNQDGTKIIGISESGSVSIWDLVKKQRVLKLNHGLRYTDAAFGKDGRSILAKTADDSCHVFLCRTDGVYRQPRLFRDSMPQKEEYPFFNLFYKGNDNAIHFVDKKGNCKMVLPAHKDKIKYACMSSNGRLLASAGCDERVRVWNVGKTAKEIMDEVSLWCKIKIFFRLRR